MGADGKANEIEAYYNEQRKSLEAMEDQVESAKTTLRTLRAQAAKAAGGTSDVAKSEELQEED